jgi:hypothetical protein
MQLFLDKINFVRRVIPSFVEIFKPLQDMNKKRAEFKWGPKEKYYFEKIKAEIMQAPMLMSHDFSKYFILYTFSSDIAFVVVLTQNNQEGNEYHISFKSSGVQGPYSYYPIIDKKSIVVFKVVKNCSPYLIKCQT